MASNKPDPNTVMGLQEAARLLGVQAAALRKAVYRGRLRSAGRAGKRIILVRWADVEEYKRSAYRVRSAAQKERRAKDRIIRQYDETLTFLAMWLETGQLTKTLQLIPQEERPLRAALAAIREQQQLYEQLVTECARGAMWVGNILDRLSADQVRERQATKVLARLAKGAGKSVSVTRDHTNADDPLDADDAAWGHLW